MTEATLNSIPTKPFTTASLPLVSDNQQFEEFLEREILRITQLLQAHHVAIPDDGELRHIVKMAWTAAALILMCPWATPPDVDLDLRFVVDCHVLQAASKSLENK